jgi:BON domain
MKLHVWAALLGSGAVLACSQQPRSSYDARTPDDEEEGLSPASGTVQQDDVVVWVDEKNNVVAVEEVKATTVPPDAVVVPAQGAGTEDVRTTLEIREALLHDDSLSFLGQNARVTTLHGRVTLRGSVESVEESKAIEGIVKKVTGSNNIDNQLEVQSP